MDFSHYQVVHFDTGLLAEVSGRVHDSAEASATHVLYFGLEALTKVDADEFKLVLDLPFPPPKTGHSAFATKTSPRRRSKLRIDGG